MLTWRVVLSPDRPRLGFMPNRRARLSLGGRLLARRRQLGLTQTQAAARIEVNRKTLAAWENGTVPEDRNFRRIADFMEWTLDSVPAVLDGLSPTPLHAASGLATVTALPGAEQPPPDDEVTRELRKMGREYGQEEYYEGLIAGYWAEKRHLGDRYLGIGRREKAEG